ncbi:MAG: hypothetical protein Q4F72_10660, partial [Desulfovibrionaceae bacterium]|nr:hypothetical protein [Desulfovibrionaceae bacterium]
MKGQINILFLGRRASGRSALANYLFDRQLFESGAGAPARSLDDPISEVSVDCEKAVVNFYDMPALEPDKYDEWMEKVQEVAEEGSSFDTNPSSWVHGAFYAISAAASDID